MANAAAKTLIGIVLALAPASCMHPRQTEINDKKNPAGYIPNLAPPQVILEIRLSDYLTENEGQGLQGLFGKIGIWYDNKARQRFDEARKFLSGSYEISPILFQIAGLRDEDPDPQFFTGINVLLTTVLYNPIGKNSDADYRKLEECVKYIAGKRPNLPEN